MAPPAISPSRPQRIHGHTPADTGRIKTKESPLSPFQLAQGELTELVGEWWKKIQDNSYAIAPSFKEYPFCHNQDALSVVPTPEYLLTSFDRASVDQLDLPLPEGRFKLASFLGIDASLVVGPRASLMVARPLELSRQGKIEMGEMAIRGHVAFHIGSLSFTLTGFKFIYGNVYAVLDGWPHQYDLTNIIKGKLGGISYLTPITLLKILNESKKENPENPDASGIKEISQRMEQTLFQPDQMVLKIRMWPVKPLFQDPSKGISVQAKEVEFEMRGTNHLSLKAQKAHVFLNWCDQAQIIQNVRLDLDSSLFDWTNKNFEGEGRLYVDKGQIIVPGKENEGPNVIDVNACDQIFEECPPWIHFNFNTSPENTNITYEASPLSLKADNKSLFGDLTASNLEGSVSGNGNQWKLDSQINVTGKFHGLVSPILDAGTKLGCFLGVSSHDLENADLNLDYVCSINESYLRWYYDPEWQTNEMILPRMQVELPTSRHPRQLTGHLTLGENSQLSIGRLDLQDFNFLIPGFTGGFSLQASSQNPRGVLENIIIGSLPPENASQDALESSEKLSINIGKFLADMKTVLTTRFLSNTMLSHIQIGQTVATLNPDSKELTVVSANPKEPYFLETKARGKLTFNKLHLTVPIDDGQLKITTLYYNPETQEITFDGDILLSSKTIPNSLLEATNLRVLQGNTDKDAEYLVRIHMKQAILSPSDIIIPNNVDISLESQKASFPPVQVAERKKEEPLYPYTQKPQTVNTHAKSAPFSFQKIIDYIPGIINGIGAIPNTWMTLPHDPGTITVSQSDHLNLSLTWKEKGDILFRVATLANKQGEEEIQKLELKLARPGEPYPCISAQAFVPIPFDENFRLRGMELIRTDIDPYTGNNKGICPNCKDGTLLVEFDSWSHKSVDFLRQLFLVSDETLKEKGIKLDGNKLTIPVDFEKTKEIIIALINSLKDSPKNEESSFRVKNEMRFHWEKAAIHVDVDIKEKMIIGSANTPIILATQNDGPQKIHAWKKENEPDTYHFDEIHFTKTRLMGVKKEGMGVKAGKGIDLEGVTLKQGTLEMRGKSLRANTTLFIDKTRFSLSTFNGIFSNIRIDNPYFIQTNTNEFRAGADAFKVDVDLHQKNREGKQIDTAFKMKSQGVLLHSASDHTLEMAADHFELSDFSIHHHKFGFKFSNLSGEDFQAYLPLAHKTESGSLTDVLVDDEKTFRFQAKKLTATNGFVTIKDFPIQMGRNLPMEDVYFEVTKDQVVFEGKNISFHMEDPKEIDLAKALHLKQKTGFYETAEKMGYSASLLEWIKKFKLPDGLEINDLKLNSLDWTGNFSRSSFVNGQATLQGDFAMEAIATVDLTMGGNRIKARLKLGLPHIYRLGINEGKIETLTFEGGNLALTQLDYAASFEKGRVKITQDDQQAPASFLSLVFPKGYINEINMLGKDNGTPWISIPLVQVEAQTYPKATIKFDSKIVQHTPGLLRTKMALGLDITEEIDEKNPGKKKNKIRVHDYLTQAELHIEDVKATDK
ncbi:MAG TPA: hypothetical protein DDW49_03015 [Deltaproteobacteria bacterium]|nr:MAG: hypothetical protein A2048_04920 [Deltaproteobacteria bacterium GWA2_45_12]HBF12351.1 hypothetical protein [Deltaproteobacteria bacterium]